MKGVIKMKTKELISKINGMANIESLTSALGINVYNLEGETIGWVSTGDFGAVDTSYTGLIGMKNKEEIVKLLFEYALTPLSEREDELKFRVRFLPGESNWETYLNQNRDNASIFIDDENNEYKQTIFTKPEYVKVQQEYSEWLPKFGKNDKHFEIIGGKINE